MELRRGRASDIVRLASDAERAPMALSAIGREEVTDLSTLIESFMAQTSPLTASAARVEALISTAEERAGGGVIQWLKVLFGAPSRERCLVDAQELMDGIRLHMDALAVLASDVRDRIENMQVWIDALQDATPSLPEEVRGTARMRLQDLKAMVANGENTYSPYARLSEKTESLQGWALRAQRAMDA